MLPNAYVRRRTASGLIFVDNLTGTPTFVHNSQLRAFARYDDQGRTGNVDEDTPEPCGYPQWARSINADIKCPHQFSEIDRVAGTIVPKGVPILNVDEFAPRPVIRKTEAELRREQVLEEGLYLTVEREAMRRNYEKKRKAQRLEEKLTKEEMGLESGGSAKKPRVRKELAIVTEGAPLIIPIKPRKGPPAKPLDKDGDVSMVPSGSRIITRARASGSGASKAPARVEKVAEEEEEQLIDYEDDDKVEVVVEASK